MRLLLIRWIAYAAVFVAVAHFHRGVKVKSWPGALGAAASFGFANLLIGWLLTIALKTLLFLPRWLTFGVVDLLILVVVNMALLKAAESMTDRALKIEGLGALATLAAAVAVTGKLVSAIF